MLYDNIFVVIMQYRRGSGEVPSSPFPGQLMDDGDGWFYPASSAHLLDHDSPGEHGLVERPGSAM